jgi:hypothetical protein
VCNPKTKVNNDHTAADSPITMAATTEAGRWPCMANTSAGTKLGAASPVPEPSYPLVRQIQPGHYNNGIERRLTDVHGHVIEPILS